MKLPAPPGLSIYGDAIVFCNNGKSLVCKTDSGLAVFPDIKSHHYITIECRVRCLFLDAESTDVFILTSDEGSSSYRLDKINVLNGATQKNFFELGEYSQSELPPYRKYLYDAKSSRILLLGVASKSSRLLDSNSGEEIANFQTDVSDVDVFGGASANRFALMNGRLFNMANGELMNIFFLKNARAVTISEDGSKLYIANFEGDVEHPAGRLVAFSLGKREIVASVSFKNTPQQILPLADHKLLVLSQTQPFNAYLGHSHSYEFKLK